MLLHNRLVGAEFTQPLLAAITVSMLISPLLIRHNKRIARFLLRETGPRETGLERLEAANQALARREHVILCGYGRVGQNVARVLESEGFEFLAIDLDPLRVRTARAAGDAVIYGDAADEGLLKSAGARTRQRRRRHVLRSLALDPDRPGRASPAQRPADPGARDRRFTSRGSCSRPVRRRWFRRPWKPR